MVLLDTVWYYFGGHPCIILAHRSQPGTHIIGIAKIGRIHLSAPTSDVVVARMIGSWQGPWQGRIGMIGIIGLGGSPYCSLPPAPKTRQTQSETVLSTAGALGIQQRGVFQFQ